MACTLVAVHRDMVEAVCVLLGNQSRFVASCWFWYIATRLHRVRSLMLGFDIVFAFPFATHRSETSPEQCT